MRIGFVLVLAVACRGEDPIPSGRLDRPSGLFVIPREAGREDVLVADSEAQGIKILQREGLELIDQTFVPAPVAFFPLVIPAPGFPTQVVATADGNRAYVVSPGSGMLHVLDVRKLPFDGGAFDGEGNQLLGSFEVEAAIGPGLTPTDVEVISTMGTTDRVALALQGAGVPDVLAVLEITNAASPALGAVATATIGPSPRGLAVVGSSALVSSAGGSAVTEVRVDRSPPVSRAIDVGGPTIDVIGAAPIGAFALRVDRPAVVHLITSTAGVARSTDLTVETYTPEEERGAPSSAGVIDVYDSPVAAGDHGDVTEVVDEDPRERVRYVTGVFDDRIVNDLVRFPGDALILAHLDGSVSFITIDGGVPRLAESFGRKVARATVRDGDASILECDASATESCASGAEPVQAICDGVGVDPVPSYQVYRATFQGSLVASSSPVLTFTGSSSVRLADPTVGSFEERLVRSGDSVLTQAQSLVCGTPITVEDRYAVGTVERVEPDALEVRYADFSLVTDCAGMPAPARAVRYQVRPSGGEVVLARVSLEEILEVVDRQPVIGTSSSAGARAVFDDRLSFTLVAGAGGFACEAGSTPCALDVECGSGRSCEDRTGRIPSCPRSCAAACEDGAEACLETLVHPRCTSVELEIFPSVPFVVSADDTTNQLPAASPADVVFSPNAGSWLISYPGSRWLAEIGATPSRTPSITR